MGALLRHHPSVSLTPLNSTTVPKFSGYPKRNASGPQKELSIRAQKSTQFLSSKSNRFADLRAKSINSFLSGSLALALSLAGVGIAEGKVGVNKPELLPQEFTPVIDVAGFLSDGQENRLAQVITAIEKDTGFKLRILVQNYPETPGLAIKDFWKVDDRTIVFVADPTFGNILNFNVGASVDLDVPRSFWSRLAGKYGNMFYWKEKGEDASIEAAVMAIGNCLREPVGVNNCSEGSYSGKVKQLPQILASLSNAVWWYNQWQQNASQPFVEEFSAIPQDLSEIAVQQQTFLVSQS